MLSIFSPDLATADTFWLVAVLLLVVGCLVAAVQKSPVLAVLCAGVAAMAFGLLFTTP